MLCGYGTCWDALTLCLPPSSYEANMDCWFMCDGACSLLTGRSNIPDGTITEHSLQVTLQR